MKKTLFLSIVLTFIFSGCFSLSFLNPFSSDEDEKKEVKIEIPQDAPSWVTNPRTKGFISTVGVATNIDNKELAFHKQRALINASHKLTRLIYGKTVNLYKSYEKDLDNPKTYDRDIKQFAEHISLKSLTHSKIKDTWLNSESNLLFIKIAVDSDIVATQIQNSSKLLFEVDKKLYQNFLSNRAYKDITLKLEN